MGEAESGAALGEIELVGFVLDLGRDLLELGRVCLGMVSAEKEVPTTRKYDPHVSLSSTPVAAVRSGQRAFLCRSGSCHISSNTCRRTDVPTNEGQRASSGERYD